jgi:hypothetical protein
MNLPTSQPRKPGLRGILGILGAPAAEQTAWFLGCIRWLLIPPTVLIAWRVALSVYWRDEREAWLRRDPGAVAFGDGRLDGQAILLTLGPLLVCLVLMAIIAAPSALRVLSIGILVVPFAAAIEFLCGPAIEQYLGGAARFHGPSVFGILALTAFFRFNFWRGQNIDAG